MKSKRVIWLLVMSLLFSTAAPASTFAENQNPAESLEACASDAEESQTPAEQTEAPETTSAEAKEKDPVETTKAEETAAEEKESATEETSSTEQTEQTEQTEESADTTEHTKTGEKETSSEEESRAETAEAESEDKSEEKSTSESESESVSESEEAESSTDSKKVDTDVIDDEFADEITDEERANSEYSTNEALIAAQNIIMPDISELLYEFRYTQVENPEQSFLVRGSKVYEEGREDARVIGISLTGSLVYVLANKDEDWVYIESGKVRGFVRNDDLTTDKLDKRLAKQEANPYTYLDCTSLGNPMNNEALTYTLTTAYDPVVEDPAKAVASAEISVYGGRNIYDNDTEVVGTLGKGALCYILADEDMPIVYVESDDVRGFVEADKLITGDKAQKIIDKTGESKMKLAEETVKPADNPALHYTITSVKEADANAGIRTAIVKFAQQVVGNPYVWGGTSLLYGADCSGFCQQVYKYFGYSLPRTSRSQSKYGTQIPVSSALPGDLIFYAKDGVVYHVAMYIGDGMTVQARGRKWGIVVCGIGKNAVWATRILE